MKVEKKFFFTKSDSVAELIKGLSRKQMITIAGGDGDGYRRFTSPDPRTIYTESTYVRKFR